VARPVTPPFPSTPLFRSLCYVMGVLDIRCDDQASCIGLRLAQFIQPCTSQPEYLIDHLIMAQQLLIGDRGAHEQFGNTEEQPDSVLSRQFFYELYLLVIE